MKFFKILLLFVFTTDCFSSVPNMEGLFRNLPSGELAGNVLIAKIQIKPSESSETEENRYLKVYFLVDDSQIEFLQIEYRNGSFTDSEIVKTKQLSNFSRTIVTDSNIERSVFYGMISMFATNLSRPLVLVLKKLDQEFLLNSNILNEEQIRLYSRQRRHLVSVKSGAISQNAPSPLHPSTEDEKKKTNEILSQDMYKKSENINLVKLDNNYYWQLKLKNIEGLFSNKDQSLQKLKIMQKESMYEYSFLNYTTMTSENILPKKIIYKAPNDRIFEAQILSFETSNITRQKLIDRFKAIEEKINKQKSLSNNSTINFIY